MTTELGYYYVRLHGGHVGLTMRRFWLWHRRQSYGFFTTRFVRAANAASAEAQAIALVNAELTEKRFEPFDHRPFSIVAEEVLELRDFSDVTPPGAGFTFYPEGS